MSYPISEEYYKAYKEGYEDGYKEAKEVFEPKHGRWEIVYYDNIPTLAACNRCDQVLKITRAFEKMPKYCPNCGAIMDEVEE